jgi:hypothetical protein
LHTSLPVKVLKEIYCNNYHRSKFRKCDQITPFIYEKVKVAMLKANNLVCRGSYDTDWKGENIGNGTSKDEPPPWHLDLIIQNSAKYKRNCKCHKQQKVKPPGRYVLVAPHQFCMNILLPLVRSSKSPINFTVH